MSDRPVFQYDLDDPLDRELAEMQSRAEVQARVDQIEAHRRALAEREAEKAREAAEATRLAAIEARRREQAAWETPFVPTSAANLILGAINRCLRFGQNALIVGAPGVGKTRALEEAVRRSDTLEGPSVGLVTVSSVMGASTMAVFEEVAPHLGVRPAFSIAATLKRLCREGCFAPVMLFDEAQNLTLRSARELLTISEQARIQMVFVGNAEVIKLVNSSQAAIQQIARRLPIREEIDCILETDADLIASRYDVEGMEAFRLCRQLADARHADGLGKVLPVARALARERHSRTVHAVDIRAALVTFPHFQRDLAGPRTVPAPQVGRQSSFKRLPRKR